MFGYVTANEPELKVKDYHKYKAYYCGLCQSLKRQYGSAGQLTLAYDMTSFRIKTEVSASPTFFGWVFGFNGKVQILAPESVKEQYRQMIAKADEDM